LVELAVPLVPVGRHVDRVVARIAVEILAEVDCPVAALLQANGNRAFLKPLVT
jgi:hypothetical protein